MLKLKEALDTLKDVDCKDEDKEAAYARLISHLATYATWEEQLGISEKELMKLLYRDLDGTNEKRILNVLAILKVCHEPERESFEKTDSELGLKALIQCGHKATSVDVIKSIMDCLCVQRFHPNVLIEQISQLLAVIEEMNTKVKAQSSSVLEKNVKIFVKLEKHIGKHLKSLTPRWSRLVFPGIANISHDVREETLKLLEKFREDLHNVQDLSRIIVKALNSGLAKSLKALMITHETYVLKAWPLIVQVTGKALHKGSTINSMLEIIEVGFKSSHVGRHNAFIAWRSLIDNFALDRALLLDLKRIKLLMMVLKIDNAKVEHVAKEKLFTWWYLCVCIGGKLSMNFETIVHPLLQFCAGGGKLQGASELCQSPRLALKASGNNTTIGTPSANVKNNLPAFPAVQKLGCEVIAHLISKVGKSEDPGKIVWTLDALPDEVLGSSAVFVKHAPVLMAALEKLFLSVGNVIEENLALHIWISLGNHLKVALDSSVKTECRDIYSTYLTILHTMGKKELLPAHIILKMIQICCSFPQKVLASTAYNITGGQTVRACPAQLLCELLLTSYLMETCRAQENFIKLFSTLMNAGASNLQGALLFLQTVAELLDSQASSLLSPEILWRMWSTLANTLKDTITTTNEVNQGDALEYNFGCMYSVLILPIKHQLPSKIPQTVNKALLKTWKDLYHSFACLSALVTTAEANSCFEEMCVKIIENWESELQEPLNLEFVSNICCKMLECVNFSAISVCHTQSGGLTLSPSKWVRRRQRPMGNLHSFVHLMATLQTELNLFLSKSDDSGKVKKQEHSASLLLFGQNQVEAYTKLFAHISSNSVISNCLAVLAKPLATFYQPIKSNSAYAVKLYVISFWNKLEKLWQEITNCIISRYNSVFDSELLSHLSPLLEVTFVHSRRFIKNKTLTLWNATFGRNSTLEYPSSLKSTLMAMKQKNTILLPGLVILNDDAVVIAETPFSEMNMVESQIPEALPSLLASPKRQKGSILNRDASPIGKLSPKPKASPAKIVSPKEVSSLFSGNRKRVELDFLPKETFVVIDSPATKKKRLLTDHQKEVLKQKCVLPAMYNSIDTSQDVSLMSQFGTETQQSLSSTDVIVVNSSQSQEHANVAMKGTKCIKGNATPQLHRSSSSPRRSVRILELKSSDETSCSEIKATDLSSVFESETDGKQILTESVSQTESKRVNEDNNSSNAVVRSISDQEKLHRLEDSGDKHINSTNNSDGTKSPRLQLRNQKNIESPFVMFRVKGEPVKKINANESTKSPRRISLRKIRSLDDPRILNCKDEKPSLSPKQIRTPRRIPLKKISDQSFEFLSEDFTSKTAYNNSCESSEKSESKLSCWTALSEQHANQKTEKSTDNSKNFKDEPILESDSSADVSCLLVEDTQSPFKVKRLHKEIDKSIEETPLKGENSISPPVKAASARKLFVDCDDAIVTQAQDGLNHSTFDTPKNNDNEIVLNFEQFDAPSSQGFQVDNNLDSQTSTEQNVTKSSHMENRKQCSIIDQPSSGLSIEAVPESENLFPNSQVSNSEMDMMMPTISSPQENVKNSFDTSQIESHKTASSDSSEAHNKQSSSSGGEFNCLNSTLAEEVLTFTPNKRKRATPKKISPNEGVRRCRKHRQSKTCLCCKNIHSPCPQKFKSLTKIKPAVNKKISNQSLSNNSEMDMNMKLSAIADEVLLSEAVLDSEDLFVSNKQNNKILQQIGEVTPDMKSLISNPERRHSSVKKTRQATKRELEISKKSSASKKIKVDSSDYDNIKSITDTKEDKNGECDRKKLKAASLFDKKRVSPQSPKIRAKILHKTRSRLRQQKRQFSYDEQSVSDEDNLPLSSIVKKCRTDDNSMNKVDNISECDTVTYNFIAESNVTSDNNIADCDTVVGKNVAECYVVFDNIAECDQAVVDVQKSPTAIDAGDCVDLEDSVTLHCHDVELLVFDADVKSALQRIKLESCGARAIVDRPNTRNSMGNTVSNSESPEITVCPDSVQDQSKQSILNLNPEREIQESAIDSMPLFGESLSNDTTESVESMLPLTPDLTKTVNHNEHVSIGSSDFNIAEKSGLSLVKGVGNVDTECSRQETADDLKCRETIDVFGCNETETAIIIEFKKAKNTEILDSIEIESVDKLQCTEVENYGSLESKSTEVICLESKTSEIVDNSETNSTKIDENLKTNVTDSGQNLNIPQQNNATDKNLNSESLKHDIREKDHDESKNEQQNLNKTILSTLTSVAVENSTGHMTKTRNDHDSLGSPERIVAVVYDWSPNRSPSCSILKRCAETPPLGKNRHVSFAEPVVSGESPVREFYNDCLIASPTSPKPISPGQKTFTKCHGKSSKYRRRLEPLKKQEPTRSSLVRKILSPQTQSTYKPTQESQLDNSKPVCPELVDCVNPLDDILPQLTSSLWYRGLCQLMKGRNINTIGDLSALTEVQIDQLPIRNPKVETVKSTLCAYMTQQGLAKSAGTGELAQAGSKTLKPKCVIVNEKVTPANIDDKGIEANPIADKFLDQTSLIQEVTSDTNDDDGVNPVSRNNKDQLSLCKDSELVTQRMEKGTFESGSSGNLHAVDDTTIQAGSSSGNIDAAGDKATEIMKYSQSSLGLKQVVTQYSASHLKKLSLDDLWDIHQSLNLLFMNVVEEMKSRHSKT